MIQLILLLAVGSVAPLLAGCSLPAPLSPPATKARLERAEVDFRVVHNVELKRGHAMAVTFSDGRRTRAITPSDLTKVQEGHFIAGPFETATAGDLKLTGALVDQEGTELARADLSLPLEPDRRYGVWVLIGSGDPTAGCLGCAGSRSFPLDPALGYGPEVALAIVWGSNSISDPIVY